MIYKSIKSCINVVLVVAGGRWLDFREKLLIPPRKRKMNRILFGSMNAAFKISPLPCDSRL